MQRARVIAAHRAPDRPAIRVAAGDPVTLGTRDTEWTDFVWTTTEADHGGWVPSRYFDKEQGEAHALQDYDTTELDANTGEELVLHHEMAGWWWAENREGVTGWVPARKLDLP